jgi:hypothetical protein
VRDKGDILDNRDARTRRDGNFALFRLLAEAVWPPSAPLGPTRLESVGAWWAISCALCIIPLTAILHHAIFYRSNCMLNPFGPEYTPRVIWTWLSNDLSLPCAAIIALVFYGIGLRFRSFRFLVAPIFLSFLPLSIWIWDIPFTGRVICRLFHDNRVMITANMPLKTRQFYIVGALMYLVFLFYLVKKHARFHSH